MINLSNGEIDYKARKIAEILEGREMEILMA